MPRPTSWLVPVFGDVGQMAFQGFQVFWCPLNRRSRPSEQLTSASRRGTINRVDAVIARSENVTAHFFGSLPDQ
jgi:hypothetical protein